MVIYPDGTINTCKGLIKALHTKGFYQSTGCSDRRLPERGALGGGDAITLRVQIPSHLHGVAGLPLLDVLVHGGLQQVGVLALGLADSQNPLGCGFHKHRGLRAAHVRPHFVKEGDF